MARQSAGILLFRHTDDALQVLLAHMGGPFWSKKDERAWSIPKGEIEPNESLEAAARREFAEELGLAVPDGVLAPLGEVKQSGGKIVTAWGLEADLDPTSIVPGTFEMEWPPGSGRPQQFPEIDRAGWFDVVTARRKIVAGQEPFLDRLEDLIGQ